MAEGVGVEHPAQARGQHGQGAVDALVGLGLAPAAPHLAALHEAPDATHGGEQGAGEQEGHEAGHDPQHRGLARIGLRLAPVAGDEARRRQVELAPRGQGRVGQDQAQVGRQGGEARALGQGRALPRVGAGDPLAQHQPAVVALGDLAQADVARLRGRLALDQEQARQPGDLAPHRSDAAVVTAQRLLVLVGDALTPPVDAPGLARVADVLEPGQHELVADLGQAAPAPQVELPGHDHALGLAEHPALGDPSTHVDRGAVDSRLLPAEPHAADGPVEATAEQRANVVRRARARIDQPGEARADRPLARQLRQLQLDLVLELAPLQDVETLFPEQRRLRLAQLPTQGRQAHAPGARADDLGQGRLPGRPDALGHLDQARRIEGRNCAGRQIEEQALVGLTVPRRRLAMPQRREGPAGREVSAHLPAGERALESRAQGGRGDPLHRSPPAIEVTRPCAGGWRPHRHAQPRVELVAPEARPLFEDTEHEREPPAQIVLTRVAPGVEQAAHVLDLDTLEDLHGQTAELAREAPQGFVPSILDQRRAQGLAQAPRVAGLDRAHPLGRLLARQAGHGALAVRGAQLLLGHEQRGQHLGALVELLAQPAVHAAVLATVQGAAPEQDRGPVGLRVAIEQHRQAGAGQEDLGGPGFLADHRVEQRRAHAARLQLVPALGQPGQDLGLPAQVQPRADRVVQERQTRGDQGRGVRDQRARRASLQEVERSARQLVRALGQPAHAGQVPRGALEVGQLDQGARVGRAVLAHQLEAQLARLARIAPLVDAHGRRRLAALGQLARQAQHLVRAAADVGQHQDDEQRHHGRRRAHAGHQRRAVALHEAAPALLPAGRLGQHGQSGLEALDVLEQGARGHVALLAIGGHGLEADALEPARHARFEARGRDRIALADRSDDLDDRAAVEGAPTGQALVEHRAHGVDVGALAHGARLAARLLGRHVGRRAEEVAALGQVARHLHLARQAEVHQARVAALVDQDVGRLDVAVHQAVGVHVLQGAGDLAHPAHGLGGRHAALLDARRQGAALDQVHGEVHATARLPHLVHAGDVRVAQARQAAGLALEALEGAARDGLAGSQDLERQVAVEALLVHAVDHAHAAAAELLDQLVVLGQFGGGQLGRLEFEAPAVAQQLQGAPRPRHFFGPQVEAQDVDRVRVQVPGLEVGLQGLVQLEQALLARRVVALERAHAPASPSSGPSSRARREVARTSSRRAAVSLLPSSWATWAVVAPRK